MILKKLTLFKCLRFKFLDEVNKSEKIEHVFNTPINTLVGKIGSGKTSFMNYTIPSIVAMSDFKAGGYRILEFEHNDSHYVISNHLEGKNKHSIIKDGVELNVSMRSKSYNEIISIELGIPQTLWNSISSTTTLTKASIGVRKEWFNILSPTNYDYALLMFKQLSNTLRDYKGAKKISVLNLTKSYKVLDSDIRNLRLNIDNIEKDIRDIGHEKLKVNIPETPPTEVRNGTLNSLTKDIEHLTSTMASNGLTGNYEEIKKSISDKEVSIQIKLGILKQRLSTAEKHLNINNTSKIVVDAREQLGYLIDKLSYGVTINNWEEVDNFLLRYGDKLIEIFPDIVSDDEFNQIDIKLPQLEKDITNLSFNITKVGDSIYVKNNTITDYERLLKEPNVNCPSCKTSFNPKIKTTIDLNSQKEELHSLQSKLEKDKVVLTSLKEEFRTLGLKRNSNIEYRNIMVTVPKGIMLNGLGDYNNIKMTLDYTRGISSLKKTIDDNKELLSTNNDNDWETESLSIKTDIHRLENELLSLKRNMKMINVLLEKQVELESTKVSLREYDAYLQQLEKAKDITDRERELIRRRNLLNMEMNTAIVNKDTTDNLNAEISTLDSKISGLNLLVTSLSPKEGLVAKSMMSFVSHCVGKMNETLSSILDYNMIIELPEVEEDGLTYRFPVRMPDNTVVKDIDSLSSGQKELVNIAWLLVVHDVLGIDMPLYLDEFGNRLDQHHKVKAFEFVSQIGNSGKQIIMITHFKEGHLYGANSKCLAFSKNEIEK